MKSQKSNVSLKSWRSHHYDLATANLITMEPLVRGFHYLLFTTISYIDSYQLLEIIDVNS